MKQQVIAGPQSLRFVHAKPDSLAATHEPLPSFQLHLGAD
jgi:hypothetical protein